MESPFAHPFQHRFVSGEAGRTLLLLHGTGGNEEDLLPLGRDLDPTAALLSPRGQVLEHGAPRFFRRLAEGVFDEADLIQRAHDLAGFVREAAERYGFDRRKIFALGYSNGANIAGGLLLLEPGLLAGAILLRPMVPLVPEPLPELPGVSVLLVSGRRDPIVPAENARRLASLLERCGAKVSAHFEEAGHELSRETGILVRRWLSDLPS